MKAFILMVGAVSMAIPISAQVAGSAGSTAAGSAAAPQTSTPAPATSAGTISGPAGAGTVTVAPGSGSNPFNPGGIIGTGPTVSPGGTFSRPTGTFGTPTVTVPNGFTRIPGTPVTAGGFPPPVGPVPPIVTNTGIGGFSSGSPAPIDSSTFPVGAPPFIGNTVGQNFVAPGTNFPPRRALSVNLPPGAVVIRNPQGVPEAVVPAPNIIPAPGSSARGVPGVTQSGTARGSVSPVVPPVIPTAPIQPPPPARNPGARIAPVPHPR